MNHKIVMTAVAALSLGLAAPAMAEPMGTATGTQASAQTSASARTSVQTEEKGFFGRMGDSIGGMFSSDSETGANASADNNTDGYNAARQNAEMETRARQSSRIETSAGTETRSYGRTAGTTSGSARIGVGADARIRTGGESGTGTNYGNN